MGEVDSIYKVIKALEKCKDEKDDKELLNDIYTIDSMIKGNIYYDDNTINDIVQKYSLELNYLYRLERSLRSFQQSSETSSYKSANQYLLNIRHSLVRVGVMRFLKRKGKKMVEDDLVNQNNENLYNKFTELMEEE